jgi:hypothetical protein
MAKRIPLVRKQKTMTGGKHEEEEKLHSMLAIPEAKRMLELDEEMRNILHRKDLLIDEKVRLFEETLGLYRQMQNAVQANGGVLLMAKKKMEPSATQTDAAASPEEVDDDDEGTKPSNLKQLLASHGFHETSKRLEFIPGSKAEEVAKAVTSSTKSPTYTPFTYDRVIRYLVSDIRGVIPSYPTRTGTRLMETIFQTLSATVSSQEEFRQVFAEYPMLESYAFERIFGDWYRMK